LNLRRYIFGILTGLTVLAWAAVAPAAESSPWKGAPVVIQDLTVTVNDPYANGFDWPGLARALIGLERGDKLTAERLEQARKSLDSLALVETSVNLSGEGASVSFTLQPYKRIKNIDVSGSYPLFHSDVLKVMTVTKGDIFKPQSVSAQAALIAQRYRDEGYIDPQVKISWEQDRSDGHYLVRVQIEKGPAYVLSRVMITGNRHVPDVVLMGLMKTWRRPAVWIGTGRFVAADLKADIQKMTAHYRSLGYADVQIDDAVERDPRRRQAKVTITIDEGPQYHIVFAGNRFFSDSALRRDLEIFTSGNRGNTGLRRGILNIRRRYLESGFADVHVGRSETAADQEPAGKEVVRIRIEEGLRHIVERVIIQGNRRIKTDEIRAQMLTRPPNGLGNGVYVASVLQEDAAAVRALYQKEGFLGSRVTENAAVDDLSRKVVVTLDVEEGVQTLVGNVAVEGQDRVAADRLLAATQLKPGTPFKPYAVADDENELAARISALGYPHVLVKANVAMSSDLARADIVFHIDLGPYVELGRIFWAGNFLTRPTVLKRQLDLKEGEPFSLAEVLAAQRRLRNLDLFQSVQVRTIGLKEKAAKVHLMVTMVEKPAHYFELGGGYETDKGIYGRTKVGDHNFLGTGKDIRLAGEQSEVGYRWEVGATDPRLLGSDVSADLGLYVENQEAFNQDFGYDTMGGKLTLARPWGPRITTALGFSYERRQQYLRNQDASSAAVDPEALEPRGILVTTPVIRWDTRDSFIQPHRGFMASLAVDISRGLESSLDNFVKYKVDLRGYHSPYQKLTLAGRAFGGYILPYGVDGQIPKDQLFFLGGTNDVRGFDENMLRFNAGKDPVGGRLALAGSVEARYLLTGNWELTLFVDAGSVQQAEDDQGDDDWRWSAGLGLRYLTPIGPIGLLYGRKLNSRPGESPGQFHISIGYTF
jgi:outer membrane protein insertion porin family